MSAQADLRLVAPALAAWLGAFTTTAAPGWWLVPAGGVAVTAGVLCWWRRRLAVLAVVVCLTAAGCAGGLRVVALRTGPVDDLAATRAAVRGTVVVTADPRRPVAAPDVPGAHRRAFVVPARLERVTARGRATRVRAPVLLFASRPGWGDLLPGQHVRVQGRLAPARHGQAVSAVLSARGSPLLAGTPPMTQRAAGGLRAGLREAVAGLPAGQRGLVPGLVVGDTSAMPTGLEEDFRTAGMTHLTAVSGANLMIVCGFVLYLARWLGVRGRLLPALGLLAMVGFVLLARPQPSVLRAAAMGAVGLLALATGRRRHSLAALSAVMLVLLLADPWLARSYGFALSVLATAGLLVLAPGLVDWLRHRGLPLPLAQALAVPAAAQAACAPVVAMLSGQVSLVSVPANLLVAPAVAPATILGVLATLAGAVSDSLARTLGALAGVPAWWIVTVAERAASLPSAAVPWPASVAGAVGLGVALAVAVLLARRAARRPLFVGGLVCVLAGLSVVVASDPGWPPPGWLLVVCDVGQGDALVLSAGAAAAVVVDAGPDPRRVDRCLRRLGVDRIPLLVLTHLHADHVEGLPGVLRGREVGRVQIGPYDEPAAELARVLAWTRAADVPVVRAVVGERGELGSLSWRVLWPRRVIEGEGSTPNNASIVLLAARAGVSMLLTGDVEPAAQRALLRGWSGRPVDVLKVAHHGSAYQAPELLAAVRPRLSLVSVGAHNDYGHPAPRTIRALRAGGGQVGRTDRDGSLAVVGPDRRLRLVRDGR